METSNYPSVGYAGLRRLFVNSARVLRPLLIIGQPGVGKTAVAEQLARMVGRTLVVFDLGNGAREDSMLPVKVDTPTGPSVVRIPLDALMAACTAPVVLFIDELTRADKNKQAIALALANERRIGSYKLHPGTIVVMAGNDGSSSGTYGLVDALVNRCCIVQLVPDRNEVRNVIETLYELGRPGETPLGEFEQDARGTPAFAEKFKALCAKYAIISGVRTELLQLSPPEGAQEACAQWASPRAVHHMLERQAASLTAGDPVDEVMLAEAGGCIGREAAAAWFAVLGQEEKLPTVDEVIASPKTARLPPDAESAIAALGLIKLAHTRDVNAAWLYVGRFTDKHPEIQAAIARDMMGRIPTDKEALMTFNAVVGKINVTKRRAS